jgi:5-methylcytosine-specific restriction protein A
MPTRPRSHAVRMRELRPELRQQYTKDTDPFYSSTRWKKTRAAFKRANPLCAECLRNNKLTPGVVCDHVIPRAVRPDLEWAWDNLQMLCVPCDATKRATTDKHGRNLPTQGDVRPAAGG